MREERDRIRERRNVKPRYKIVREEIRKEKFVYDFIHYKNGKVVRTSLKQKILYSKQQDLI